MRDGRWTWPEYRRLSGEIDELTGEKRDPANKTLRDLFGRNEPRKPESVEDRQRREGERAAALEAVREAMRRRITDRDLQKRLRFDLSRSQTLRKLAIPEERLEGWESRVGATAEGVARLAGGGLSDKKLANRIARFEVAAEQHDALADLLEERLEEESTIRRVK